MEDKDEFDEFKNFNRDDLNKMFSKQMEDEEFKKKFIEIINGYQSDIDSIMKLFYGTRNPFNNQSQPFKNLGLDFTSFNEDGWNSEHWSTPDGKTQISSFTRSMTPEEFFNNEKKNKEMNMNELPAEYIIQMLENKLDECLSEENYEEAAELRDTIKGLKEDDLKEKIKK